MKGRRGTSPRTGGRKQPPRRAAPASADPTAKSGSWQLQAARAHLSDLVTAAARAPQHITRNGKPVAVVLSQPEYDRLTRPRLSLVELFQKSPLAEAMAESDVSFERDQGKLRDVDL